VCVPARLSAVPVTLLCDWRLVIEGRRFVKAFDFDAEENHDSPPGR